jgi:hypothetical protein
MRFPERHYVWQWQLQSDAETLWPLVTNTNRFDRDSGTPRVSMMAPDQDETLTNARARVRMPTFGFPLEYVQEPFEWTYPHRFGVTRRFTRGPVAELRTLGELFPQPGGGTLLSYQVWMRGRNLLGHLAIPIQALLVFRRTFGRSFREYDQLVTDGKIPYTGYSAARFVPGGRKARGGPAALLADGADLALVNRLVGSSSRATR